VRFDTHPPKEAPVHELRFDKTEVGTAKLATFTEIVPVTGATLNPGELHGLRPVKRMVIAALLGAVETGSCSNGSPNELAAPVLRLCSAAA
jgi:hypothetical protein